MTKMRNNVTRWHPELKEKTVTSCFKTNHHHDHVNKAANKVEMSQIKYGGIFIAKYLCPDLPAFQHISWKLKILFEISFQLMVTCLLSVKGKNLLKSMWMMINHNSQLIVINWIVTPPESESIH